MSWINFCRMNEAIEDLTPTGSIGVIRRSWDDLPEKDLVASLLTMEYPQNNLGKKKAIKWITKHYGVFDDEIENYANIYGDLGEGIYFFDENGEDSELSITNVYNILCQDCSSIDGIGYTLFSSIFETMSALEKKWFVRYWTRTLRHGFGKGNFGKLLAKQYGKKESEVKKYLAVNSFTDITKCYEAGEEPSYNLAYGTFIKPMLAKVVDMNKWPRNRLMDVKYDGARYQIHRKQNEITIFNRKGVIVTQQFPDIAEECLTFNIKNFIIDTEIYPVLTNGRPAEFKKMNTRFHSKNHDEAALKCPVTMAVFDALMVDGVSLIDEPLRVRMASIERFPYQALRAKEGQNSTEFYNEAIAGGFEGIMVKDLNGLYESGKRKWIKYKPPLIDFDVLITGARYGDGKRSNVFASYDIAVGDKDGPEKYGVGAVGTGFSDMDLIHLTRILKPLVMGFNSSTQTHLFMKRIVINVTADLVTRNDKGEYGLRFPRFLSIREDKPVSEINTINDVTWWYSG